MIRWFDANEHQQFAAQLAAVVIENLPLVPGAKRPKKASPHEVVRKMVQRITDFRAKCPTNVYQKAKLANAFRWKLTEAGYEAGFADELAKELLIHFR